MPTISKTTIADSETDSGQVDLGHHSFLAIEVPAGFEGTAISFKGAGEDGGTPLEILDNAGSAISITVAAGKITTLSNAQLAALAPIRFLTLVGGTAQTGDSELTVHLA